MRSDWSVGVYVMWLGVGVFVMWVLGVDVQIRFLVECQWKACNSSPNIQHFSCLSKFKSTKQWNGQF